VRRRRAGRRRWLRSRGAARHCRPNCAYDPYVAEILGLRKPASALKIACAILNALSPRLFGGGLHHGARVRSSPRGSRCELLPCPSGRLAFQRFPRDRFRCHVSHSWKIAPRGTLRPPRLTSVAQGDPSSHAAGAQLGAARSVLLGPDRGRCDLLTTRGSKVHSPNCVSYS
jgi:hypothetical protein